MTITNTDEAIAYARSKGFRVWSMQQVSQGGMWRVRLWDMSSRTPGSYAGYADTLTGAGEGVEPWEAILDAMERLIDPLTGQEMKPRISAPVSGLPDEFWKGRGTTADAVAAASGTRTPPKPGNGFPGLGRAVLALSGALGSAIEARRASE